MNPNELRKLKQKAPFPLVLMLLLFFLSPLVVEPMNERLQANSGSFQSELKTARKLVVKRRQNSILKTRFSKYLKIENDLGRVLPNREALPEIINSIHLEAGEAKINIEQIRYEFHPEIDGLKVPVYKLNLNVTAQYKEFRKFISRLECLRYPLIIREIVAGSDNNYSIVINQMVKL